MKNLGDTYTLSNGYEIPCVGFGTWRIPGGEPVISAVKKALEVGYCHIDTAAYYYNEEGVGEAVRQSDIGREKVFITSKVWERGYREALSTFDRSLNKLKMDYVDLYLIHWPANAKVYKNWRDVNAETWRALVEMYKKGRAKAIGVSNFLPHHLEPLMGFDTLPM
ncbi:MAG: aldo/keto reductase, partial [Clostridiales bacterium]|nr:aldo/keto reductase [Clostridiales bacterium]